MSEGSDQPAEAGHLAHPPEEQGGGVAEVLLELLPFELLAYPSAYQPPPLS